MLKTTFDQDRLAALIEKRLDFLDRKYQIKEDPHCPTSAEILKGWNYTLPFESYEEVVEQVILGITLFSERMDDGRNQYLDTPEISCDSLARMESWEAELFEEVSSCKYLQAYMFDQEQGTPLQKALDIVFDQEYTIFESYQDYLEERESAINEELDGEELDGADDEEAREALEHSADDHAIQLSDGKVCFIKLSVRESVESVL